MIYTDDSAVLFDSIHKGENMDSPYNRSLLDLGWTTFAWAASRNANEPPTYEDIELKKVGQYRETFRPFGIDFNHVEGAEMLQLAVVNGKGETTPRGYPGGPLDLAGKVVRITAQFKPKPQVGEDLNGAGVFFYFSTLLPKENGHYPERIAEYVFSKRDLRRAMEKGTAISFRLTDDMRDWLCLGRNRLDCRCTHQARHYSDFQCSAMKHTCAVSQREFADAVRKVQGSIGIVMCLPRGPALWTNLQQPNPKVPWLWKDDCLRWKFIPTKALDPSSVFRLKEFRIDSR